MKKAIITGFLIASFLQGAFAQDAAVPPEKLTICLNSGKQISNVKLWRLHDEFMEYEKEGSLHDVAIDKIKMIKSGSGDYEIVNHKIRKAAAQEKARPEASHAGAVEKESGQARPSAEANPERTAHAVLPAAASENDATRDTSLDYEQWGRQDAKKYYNGTGAFLGGMLLGPYAAPVIAAVPPSAPGKNNPNSSLYVLNEDYRKGYKKAAHGKKAIRVLEGFGVFIFSALVIGGIASQ